MQCNNDPIMRQLHHMLARETESIFELVSPGGANIGKLSHYKEAFDNDYTKDNEEERLSAFPKFQIKFILDHLRMYKDNVIRPAYAYLVKQEHDKENVIQKESDVLAFLAEQSSKYKKD